MYSAKDRSLTEISPEPVLSVSELTARIKMLLEDSFDRVAVVGEISNAKVYPSGHWYFSLKDQDSTIPCVCFRGTNSRIKFELEDGIEVVARGKLSVYPPRGAYQLIVAGLEPVGVGEWQLAFEQLKSKLEKEGLLAPEKKRKIPIAPRKIGVVTSPAGAAVRDILNTLRRRNENVSVLLSPAKVQGEGSPEEIAAAIDALNSLDDIDVIIVARGGGSIEDLWSFNTEIVARAVAACSVPTVSGVGHETDITICDLVADLRAPTPTAAAELVSAGYIELTEKWATLTRRLGFAMDQRLQEARYDLDRLNPLEALLRYEARLKQFLLKTSASQIRLTNRITFLVNQARHRWRENHEKLEALGPLNVLNRGFSILRRPDGTLVRQACEVKEGEILEALLSSGKLKLKVESIEEDWS